MGPQGPAERQNGLNPIDAPRMITPIYPTRPDADVELWSVDDHVFPASLAVLRNKSLVINEMATVLPPPRCCILTPPPAAFYRPAPTLGHAHLVPTTQGPPVDPFLMRIDFPEHSRELAPFVDILTNPDALPLLPTDSYLVNILPNLIVLADKYSCPSILRNIRWALRDWVNDPMLCPFGIFVASSILWDVDTCVKAIRNGYGWTWRMVDLDSLLADQEWVILPSDNGSQPPPSTPGLGECVGGWSRFDLASLPLEVYTMVPSEFNFALSRAREKHLVGTQIYGPGKAEWGKAADEFERLIRQVRPRGLGQ